MNKDLFIFNSLTKTKENFIPRDNSRVVWYQCGPTVYSDSHIGHARTYISLDIIHRIMRNYLGYNLIVCQNITDIDDKIINKSNQEKIPFQQLARKYENDFFEDMEKLGVNYPDILTRVSEYITEIIDYINEIINKGFAYELNGSVYFDTEKFKLSGNIYGKLVPEQCGNSELLKEGEGSLTIQDKKRSESDFVLWKKTKDEILEPFWESPWGRGRPGWHIECSVMSYNAFENISQGYLDIHAGGVDLKFPHHENEEAQSTAYLGCCKWTNYWLHTGHLNIKGMKMSKSLKNFITIREALKEYTPRQIRLCFVMHKYNTTMDYSEESMINAVNIEKIFNDFFKNIQVIIRDKINNECQHIGKKEDELLKHFEDIKIKIHNSILDDFDTPRCINYLLEFIKIINRYIETDHISSILLNSFSIYITKILKLFGIINDCNNIGFPLNNVNNDRNTNISPFIDLIINFRNKVRELSKNNIELLIESDKIRDNILPKLGIQLEDKDQKTIWKIDNPENIESLMLKKNKEKEKNKNNDLILKQKKKEEKMKIHPKDLFRNENIYSLFDEDNIPTHDNEGKPISKSQYKKLKKLMEKHKQNYKNDT
jgi:cysteinyl-tRNA synthetase